MIFFSDIADCAPELLFIYDNQISDISHLANLTKLKYLYLSNNQIKDISALHGLTQAQRIDLEENNEIKCTDLDALEAKLGTGVVKRPSSCAP